MAEFSTFKGSWPWPWPWIGSYYIPSCITHRPLHTYRISLKSKKRLWTYGRTDRRTADRHLRPTLLGRLGGLNKKLNLVVSYVPHEPAAIRVDRRSTSSSCPRQLPPGEYYFAVNSDDFLQVREWSAMHPRWCDVLATRCLHFKNTRWRCGSRNQS